MGCSPFDVDDLDVAVNSNVPKLLGSMLPPPSPLFRRVFPTAVQTRHDFRQTARAWRR